MKKAIVVSLSILAFAGVITLTNYLIPKNDYLLVSGSGWNKVSIIDKSTNNVVWEHALQPGDDSHDVEMTKEGHILYSYKGGARLVDRATQNIIWDFKAKPGEELHSATQTKDGGYCLASAGKPARIILLDKAGQQTKEIPFDTQFDNVHLQFRHLTPTEKGTYLYTCLGKGNVVELNEEGKVVNEIKVPGNPFGLTILDNGNYLVGCGDAGCVVEVNPETKEVKTFADNESSKPHPLYFIAESRRLKNGHTITVNWRGHTQDRTAPSLYEFDPSGNIVWTLESKPERGEISAVYAFSE